MLSEAQGESMMRIAQHCASTHRGQTSAMSLTDRYEAALSGIAEYLCDHGWPDGELKPLFLAGANGITRESRARDMFRHLRHWSYWYEPPGSADALGEKITDRIAVHQLCWAMPEDQWGAVWAVAEVMRRDGTMSDAAALLGIGTGLLSNRLTRARRTARRLWVAPDETPPGFYQPGNHDKGSRLQEWKRNRRQSERKRERRAA